MIPRTFYYKRLFLIITCLLISFLLLADIEPAWAVNYSQQNLVERDFSGQDLRDAIFDHANLRGANFSHANLQGVRFFSANLESANFEEADLRFADLESARLIKVNFTNAILEGAFVTNTLFGSSTIIDGADFTDVFLRPDTEQKLCTIAKGTNPMTGRNTKDTLFCP
ncbi:pentapeptide repeat-containing protein [Crocosphaera sp. XPORK-15E]|uniref:pentapeptide repeat-containing protein n=1 Tax=Crocosphaera sp. XPORK-15E TaxID=3110247 RepID=UPI002B20FB5D|nr:pentapeptide repeat-containing protein [Crocosphaera sp. XPORK-15E]MEA5532874.1 pentapeptide repeat-containing protein [Crocosphaera sp. XPORK-15E]